MALGQAGEGERGGMGEHGLGEAGERFGGRDRIEGAVEKGEADLEKPGVSCFHERRHDCFGIGKLVGHGGQRRASAELRGDGARIAKQPVEQHGVGDQQAAQERRALEHLDQAGDRRRSLIEQGQVGRAPRQGRDQIAQARGSSGPERVPACRGEETPADPLHPGGRARRKLPARQARSERPQDRSQRG